MPVPIFRPVAETSMVSIDENGLLQTANNMLHLCDSLMAQNKNGTGKELQRLLPTYRDAVVNLVAARKPLIRKRGQLYDLTVFKKIKTKQVWAKRYREKLLKAVTEFLEIATDDGAAAMFDLIKQILAESKYKTSLPVVKEVRKQTAKVIQRLQEHWDGEATAIIKCTFNMSYENIERLKRILSYHREQEGTTDEGCPQWTDVRNFLEYDSDIPGSVKLSRLQLKHLARTGGKQLYPTVLYDHYPLNEHKRVPKVDASKPGAEASPFWTKGRLITQVPTLIAGRKVSRYNLQRVPMIAGKQACKAVIDRLAKSYGYTVSPDGKGVELTQATMMSSIVARIRGEPIETFTFDINNKSSQVVCLQYTGDGYRHFKNRGVTQLGLICGFPDGPLKGQLQGAIRSIDLLSLWEGGECRANIEERGKDALALSDKIFEDGGVVKVSWATKDPIDDDGRDIERDVAIDQIGGGDASWQQKAGAQADMSWCLWCECHKDHFHIGKQSHVRFNSRQAYLSHMFPSERHKTHGVWVLVDGASSGDQRRYKQFNGHSGLLVEDSSRPRRFRSTQKYHVVFDSHEETRGHEAEIPGRLLQHGFRCPISDCPGSFADESDITADIVLKSHQTASRKIHKGITHNKLTLFRHVERWKWIVCFLHFVLNTVVSLFADLIVPECKNKVIAQGVCDLFTKYGISKPSGGAKGNMNKSMFIGIEAELFLAHGNEFWDVVFEKNAAMKKKAYLVNVYLLDYINVIYMRYPPSIELKNTLVKLGEKAIAAKAAATANEKIRMYWHAMVCAIPMQSQHYVLMQWSGQGLENLNRYSKAINSNRRNITEDQDEDENPEFTDEEDEPNPKRKMTVGHIEQNMKQRLAMTTLNRDSQRVPQTQRERQRDRGQVGTTLLVFHGERPAECGMPITAGMEKGNGQKCKLPTTQGLSILEEGPSPPPATGSANKRPKRSTQRQPSAHKSRDGGVVTVFG